ncbi:hypothetical protein TGVEG_442510, partial [Toxoplasma gondii VEG]
VKDVASLIFGGEYDPVEKGQLVPAPAWSNPVTEANDPSSLVSEHATCVVWRPHTVLPFSRMSLVAYLRGWVVFRRGCSLIGSDSERE